MPEGTDGEDAERTVLARIADSTIDRAELEAFVVRPNTGALVVFEGVVRDHDHGAAVTRLDYSAHPDAAAFLERTCAELAAERSLRAAAAHRVGSLAVGEVAMVVAVAAAHRAEAFAACADLVDRIKSSVPIWKRQQLADGETEWLGLDA